jgi:hypothetical protein
MNTRFLWTLGMALAPTLSAFGQSMRESLEGVWQAAEVTHGGSSGAETIKAGPNLAIFTSKHYSRIDVQTDKPRPVLANPASASAEELREVWGPLVAEAGSYERTDRLITLHPMVAKNPAVMAPDVTLVYSYKLEGNSLTLTAQRDRNGPVASPFTVKFVRIE